jgi:hypothetical protein
LGFAQLLGIELRVPKIFKLAAQFRTSANIDIELLRSEARLVPQKIDFDDAWWLEEDGVLFIPQSVSRILIHEVMMHH